MVNYQNTKIYKIESHLGPKIYIGSTTKEYLSQRMDSHRSGYKHWKNGNGGNMSSYQLFDDYGLENCNILLIESYPCNSKDERASREGYYIKTTHCVNKIIPGRTPKEYYDDNKEKLNVQGRINAKVFYENHKDQKKEYYEVNKDKIRDKQQQYYEDNKDIIKIQSKVHRETHKKEMKQYRQENAEIIKEYNANYYEANKEKIKEQYSQSFVCECNGKYKKYNKIRI